MPSPSHESGQPNLFQQELDTQVDAARQATQASGDYYDDNPFAGRVKDEVLQAGHSVYEPSVTTSHSAYEDRVDVRVDTGGPGNDGPATEIHAYVGNRIGGRHSNGEDDTVAATNIRRYDGNGNLVYTHRYKSANTARKFGALVASHVANHAEAKQARAQEADTDEQLAA